MLFLAAVMVACAPSGERAAGPTAPASQRPGIANSPVTIVFLGDSLTAGAGLGPEESFPSVLAASWTAAGLSVEVVNAGLSGDTTEGGLRRLDWVLGQEPEVVVVELGANDMLRGLPVAAAETNLRTIVSRCQAAGAAVVLLGLRADPRLGPDYVAAFDSVFPRLAADFAVPLVPDLLDGIRGEATLTQVDGLHPSAAGHRRLATVLGATIEPVVRARSASPG
ncbi:MAG: arylesterase [Myxococcales bacterium]|nr:arylesterase [Myxococcales bacterium]